MTDDLTVDASVWVAAADPLDAFHQESQSFLVAVEVAGLRLNVPAFAAVEIACALARKRRNPAGARRLAEDVLRVAGVTVVPVDVVLIESALQFGTNAFLRGADALYAATAQLTDSTLLSWDDELIRRAGALSPTDWLAANP